MPIRLSAIAAAYSNTATQLNKALLDKPAETI